MKLVIDHSQCQHGGWFADRCLGATIRYPLGHERTCAARVEDDGQSALTVVLVMDGQEYTRVFRSEEDQRAAALEGWTGFIPTAAGAR